MDAAAEDRAGPLAGPPRSRTFLSYSSRDETFARELEESLLARGLGVWRDDELDRTLGEWRRAVESEIDACDSFVFVLSRNSLASAECDREWDRAAAQRKPIFPVLAEGSPRGELLTLVDDKHKAPHWTDGSRGLSDDQIAALAGAILRDPEWREDYRRWQDRAIEWDEGERRARMLLSRHDAQRMRAWLASDDGGKSPRPTPLQREFLERSRARGERIQRFTIGGLVAVMVVLAGLLVTTLLSRSEATERRRDAEAARTAAFGALQADANPALALSAAAASFGRAESGPARYAARRLLDAARPIAIAGPRPANLAPVGACGEGQRERPIVPGVGAAGASPGDDAPEIGVGLDVAASRPDRSGGALMMAGADGALIWPDPLTGRVVPAGTACAPALIRPEVGGPGGPAVATVAVSADGGQAALARIAESPSPGGEVRTIVAIAARQGPGWDARTRFAALGSVAGAIGHLAILGDGSTAATLRGGGGGDRLAIWPGGRDRPIVLGGSALPGGVGTLTSLTAAPRGRWFAVTTSGSNTFFLVGRGGRIAGPPDGSPHGRGGVRGARFSASGARLVSFGEPGSGPGNPSLAIWDLLPGGNLDLVDTAALLDGTAIRTAALDHHGTTVVASGAGDGQVMMVGADASSPPVPLHGHIGAITDLGLSADGRFVVSAGADGTVRLWRAAGGDLLTTLRGHQGRVLGLAGPAADRVASVGRDGTARLWHLGTGRPELVTAAMAVAPRIDSVHLTEHRLVIQGHGPMAGPPGAAIVDLATGRIADRGAGFAGPLSARVVPPDGEPLTARPDEGCATEAQFELAAFSPGGEHRLAISREGAARVVPVGTRGPVRRLPVPERSTRTAICEGALSDDGATAVLRVRAGDSPARHLEIHPAGRAPMVMPSGPGLGLTGMSLAPGGACLAAILNTGTVRLFAPGQRAPEDPAGREFGASQKIGGAVFRADGRALATFALSGVVTVRPVGAGCTVPAEPERTLFGHVNAVRAAAFSPAGDLLATGGDDGTLRIWDIAPGAPEALPITTVDLGADVVAIDWQETPRDDGFRIAAGLDDGRVAVVSCVACARPLPRSADFGPLLVAASSLAPWDRPGAPPARPPGGPVIGGGGGGGGTPLPVIPPLPPAPQPPRPDPAPSEPEPSPPTEPSPPLAPAPADPPALPPDLTGVPELSDAEQDALGG